MRSRSRPGGAREGGCPWRRGARPVRTFRRRSTRPRQEPNPKPRQGRIETLIPARLERLPWGRFHVLVVAALGITWILDGLEVTLAGSVAGALKTSPALHFSDAAVGFAASAYLIGAVVRRPVASAG